MTKKTKELKSMVQYIVDIDFMTTSEFCNAYKVPHPQMMHSVEASCSELLRIDAVKHGMFTRYAKFLNKRLTLELFVGPNAVFTDFHVGKSFEDRPVLLRGDSKQVYAWLDEQDPNNQFTMIYPRRATRVEQMIGIIENYLVNEFVLQ